MSTRTTTQPHVPVLLAETIEALRVQSEKWYIDATIGAGGHAREIVNKGGFVLGIDQDRTIATYVRNIIDHNRLVLVHGNFNNLAALAKDKGVSQVAGVLMDLGVSSIQLDTPHRGFSFQAQAPLDMRMDTKTEITAAEIVNTYSEDQLFALLTSNSQERSARKIARAIVQQRHIKPLETTRELATLIEQLIGSRPGSIHPATKTFQALRMEVNQEIGHLKQALPQALGLLEKGGRLAIISFHETEDRIVKYFMSQAVSNQQALAITKKPLSASREEIITNPRSRSAKLRIIEKL